MPVDVSPLRIQLPSGVLRLDVETSDLPLDVLCGFACRRNPRRGYLFVSKVLGKHWPVRPRTMHDIHRRLAAKLAPSPQPTVILGLAETAVGLGAGVFDAFIAAHPRVPSLYMQTTRCPLRRECLLEAAEPHSHAPHHFLYLPASSSHQHLLDTVERLIVVDDELSTGVTLANLARAFLDRYPRVSRVELVSITDWLTADRRHAVRQELGSEVLFHSLLQGTFTFAAAADFAPEALPASHTVDSPLDDHFTGPGDRWGRSHAYPSTHVARYWPQVWRDLRLTQLPPGARLLVLGTGEFLYPPFLLGRALEAEGFDVSFQSTTRSPILRGDMITEVATFADHWLSGVANYLYNVRPGLYDRIYVCYDQWCRPDHRLPAELAAIPLFFSDPVPPP